MNSRSAEQDIYERTVSGLLDAAYLSAIPMSVSLPCPALIVSSARGKSSDSATPSAATYDET